MWRGHTCWKSSVRDLCFTEIAVARDIAIYIYIYIVVEYYFCHVLPDPTEITSSQNNSLLPSATAVMQL